MPDRKAAIFDLDGTMVDNHVYHKDAWMEFCRRRGFDFDDSDFKTKIFGKTSREFATILMGDVSEDELKSFEEEKESIYRSLYKDHIQPISGLIRFLDDLRRGGFLLGVATSAPRVNLDFSLAGLELEGYFDSLMCLNDIAKEKPDPEIYIKSMMNLEVDPANSVVFEDSLPGVTAGTQAKAKVVGISTSLHASEMTGASLVIEDYREITSETIIELI